MRILFSCGSPSWGGLEMQTLTLAKTFQFRGHEVMLLSQKNTTLTRKAIDEGLKVKELSWTNWNTVKNIFEARKIVKNFLPDIIHTQLSHDLWVLAPAKSAYLPAKLILTKRMASKLNKKDLLHNYLYSQTDHILCVSEFIRRNVIETVKIAPESVSVLHNGLYIDKFNPKLYKKNQIRAQLQIDEHAFVIGFLGRFTYMKGHQEYFEACSFVQKSFPDMKLTFLVAGGDSFGEGVFGEKMRSVGKQILGSEHVIFTGDIANSAEVLASMDVLVFPSHEESFGNVLCEAGAMQIPVVASNSGGVPDIVEDGVTGVLVPPRDSKALAEGIRFYIKHLKNRMLHGNNAREYIIQKFQFEKQIDKLEKMYESLIG
jgi:glycosyltransferase involved in cell wall biosynthesis